MYKNVMQQMSKGFGRPCLKTVFKAFSSYRKLENSAVGAKNVSWP